MPILRTLPLVAVAILQLPVHATRTDPVLVTNVLQGDAIEVAALGRVRLLGIVAPKRERRLLTPDAVGLAAFERLTSLVAHRYVRLEFEARGGSVHAAYVVLEDGTFVNEVLVREGLARVTAHGVSARATSLQDAEAAAQASRRGLWAR